MKKKCCIAHRDIKIDNIILSKDGIYLLADFGCSIILENENEKVFGHAGTLSYLAPEVFQNYKNKDNSKTDYDPFAADIYSLAIVILQLMGL